MQLTISDLFAICFPLSGIKLALMFLIQIHATSFQMTIYIFPVSSKYSQDLTLTALNTILSDEIIRCFKLRHILILSFLTNRAINYRGYNYTHLFCVIKRYRGVSMVGIFSFSHKRFVGFRRWGALDVFIL